MNFTKKERRDFAASVFNDGILQIAQGKPIRGQIKEVDATCRTAAERYGLVPAAENELHLPMAEVAEVCRAALSTGTYSSGGSLIGEQLGDIQEALRPVSVCVAAGAQVFTNLTSNFALPLEKTASSGNWTTEVVTSDFTQSDGTVGRASFSPNQFVVATSMSRQLITQTGGLAEQYKLASLARDCGQGLDSACLVGTGTLGQPLGLFKRTDVGSVTLGGAATWTKIAGTSGFIPTVLNNNLRSENLSWVIHPSIAAKWKTLTKVSSDAGAGMLFDVNRDYIGAYAAHQTTAVSSTLGVALGSFDKMVIALFGPGEGGLRITVDPYSKSLSDRVNLVVTMLADTGLTRPEAFVISADSAVQ